MWPTTTAAPGAARVTTTGREAEETDDTRVRSVWPSSAPSAPKTISAIATASWSVKPRCDDDVFAASRDDVNGVSRTRCVSTARASALPRPS